jgi:hypothetical protein
MNKQQIAASLTQLERIRAEAARTGVPLDEASTKEMLRQQTSAEGVNTALQEIEHALRSKVRAEYEGQEEPPSVNERAQPHTPKKRPKFGPDVPPQQFSDLPKQLPAGHEDLPEKHGESRTPSPGGKAESVRRYTGKEVHDMIEILLRDPEVMKRLLAETGSKTWRGIFSARLPEGLVPEFEIPHPDFPRKPRIDRLWRKGDTIFEIKPNTPGSRERGLIQADQYARWMMKYGELPHNGRKWKIRVITYNQAKMIKFLRAIGKLPQ